MFFRNLVNRNGTYADINYSNCKGTWKKIQTHLNVCYELSRHIVLRYFVLKQFLAQIVDIQSLDCQGILHFPSQKYFHNCIS